MTSSYQSQQEKAFRMLGAPPDISKTNYLETEVDMVEAVNKQIDENQKDLERHYDQLINIWNHQFEKDARAPQQLLDLVKTGKQAYFDVKEFNEFNKRLSKQRRGLEAVENAKTYATSDLLKYQEAVENPDYASGLKELTQYEAVERARLLQTKYGEDAATVALENNEPGIAHLIRQGVGNINEFYLSNIKDQDDLKNHFPLFLDLARSGMQVDVSHIYGNKPGTNLKTLDNAEPGEFDYIYNAVLSNYLYNHSPIAYGTGDRIDRNLLKHFVEKKAVDHKSYLESYGKATLTAGRENAGEL